MGSSVDKNCIKEEKLQGKDVQKLLKLIGQRRIENAEERCRMQAEIHHKNHQETFQQSIERRSQAFWDLFREEHRYMIHLYEERYWIIKETCSSFDSDIESRMTAFRDLPFFDWETANASLPAPVPSIDSDTSGALYPISEDKSMNEDHKVLEPSEDDPEKGAPKVHVASEDLLEIFNNMSLELLSQGSISIDSRHQEEGADLFFRLSEMEEEYGQERLQRLNSFVEKVMDLDCRIARMLFDANPEIRALGDTVLEVHHRLHLLGLENNKGSTADKDRARRRQQAISEIEWRTLQGKPYFEVLTHPFYLFFQEMPLSGMPFFKRKPEPKDQDVKDPLEFVLPFHINNRSVLDEVQDRRRGL